jgi:hypothetical protein
VTDGDDERDLSGPHLAPAWCRIGLTGVEASSDLLVALVPGELHRRLDELLPGVQLVVLTAEPGPVPVEIEPLSRLEAEIEPGDVHLIVDGDDVIGAGLDLLQATRAHDPLHDGWRGRWPLPVPEGAVTVVEIADGSPVVEPEGDVLLVDPWSPDMAAGLLLDAYVDATTVHARSPGGVRLAQALTPERIAAAERLVSDIADQALAAVVEADGAAVVRRQLSAWSRWGRALRRAHEAAEQRHRSASAEVQEPV